MCTLTIVIPVAEHDFFLQRAAETMSKNLKIAGFRPGHVPFEIVKKEVGEMRLLEVASEEMIKKGLVQAVKENTLETVGAPEVSIKKMTPGNDVEVEIQWALLPQVTLPKLETVSVKQEQIDVTEKELDASLKELARMRATETATTETATETSRLVVDMEITIDHVVIEGGTTKGHSIILDEPSYLPGLTEKLIGASAGETKTFSLDFPKEYYNKQFAGKTAEFTVKVTEVFARTTAKLDDEFAQGLRFETLEKLRDVLRDNIRTENESKATDRARAELIDTLVSKSTIGEIPQILIDAEKERLFAEFKAHIESQGLTIDQYVADVKQTPEQIADGMQDKALARIKGSLVLRSVARQENIEVTDEELGKELEDVRRAYAENPHIEERLQDPSIVEYIAMNLRHRKTTDYLAGKLISK